MTARQIGIVGAGIVGLAHAWSAAQRGYRVTVFERSPWASGASIRNFGMIWPIGQPAGPLRDLALESRQRWLELGRNADVWVGACGSIHLAHRADEWAVLQEFHARGAEMGIECSLLTPPELQQRAPAANQERLLGGLFSPTELVVNPRASLRAIPRWLAKRYNVQFEFGVSINDVGAGEVAAADGRRWNFERVVICSGADVQTLFPEALAHPHLKTCKLQMLRTKAQPGGWRIGPHLASGLTLRHYRNFDGCPSLPELQQRIARETPELDHYGIHVMASQNDRGEVILGDSHEYGSDIEPFDKTYIEDLMLRELRSIICLPDWSIAERWNGIYLKLVDAPVFESEPLPQVHLCTGTGGAGMTMSFGIAERAWRRWCSE